MVNVHGVAAVAGGTFPASIWHDYMSTATQGQSKCNYRSIDAGTNKVNPDLVAGPPTSSTTTVPGAPAVPGATTVAPPAGATPATTTVKPAAPAATTVAPPAAPPP
jgi:hypothetical protein